MKKVFISYSHKDKDWKNSLLPHLRTLEQQGDIVLWDDQKIGGGEDWYPAIKDELDQAAVAICLISADYLASNFINKEEIPVLKERRTRDGMLLLPVLVRPCPWKTVQWLKRIQMMPGEGKSLAEIRGKVNQEKALSRIAEYVYDKMNDPQFQVPAPTPEWPALADSSIDIERLPKTGEEVFGRAKELSMLDDAWESPDTHIISFVAWGGVEKSALVNKWVHQMSNDNYRGAKRVYAWSFYSQGTGLRVTSADMFVNNALHWFGDSKMAESKSLPWDKGKRLAELIQQQRTLLVLDGLEPMQSDYEHDKGAIKDPALEVLLKQLAVANDGLCVITTREWPTGISKDNESIVQENLEQISPEAGRALLRVNGTRGTDSELEQATRDFGCHALAINLLIAYLQDTSDRHIRNAALIPDLDIPEQDGKHPRRVMEALAARFGPSPELNVLHIMGLFDRPASAKEIKWLRTREEVPDLTDRIRWLADDDWDRVINNLRHFRLIAPETHHNIGGLDAHPFVRVHFGQRLKDANEESFKQGHFHLYEFLKMSAPRLPHTLEEMEPLFAAVTHGCLAGRFQETFDDVYWKRILRGNEKYIWKKLGAVGADLAAVSCFFERPWSKPADGLTDEDKALVLNFAGFALRALGRLTEAAEPMNASMQLQAKQEDSRNAASAAGNLSELYLTLGDVKKAMDYGQKGVEYADRSLDKWMQVGRRTNLGESLHNFGDLRIAESVFLEAEKIIKEEGHAYLFAVWGFRFSQLLIDKKEYRTVQIRANTTKQDAINSGNLLDIPFENLSLGHASLVQAQTQKSNDYTKSADFLSRAVDGLREAGTQDHLPRALLARAELYRYQGSWKKAWADLEEAREIAERGEMNLYMADYHIEAARLYLAEGDANKSRENFTKAEALVGNMGYHRRDPELLLIKAELETVEGKKEAAKKTLEQAKKRIDDMGCHRWDIETARLEKSFEC